MVGRADALHAHLRAFAFPLLRTPRGRSASLTSLPEAEAQAVQDSLTGFAAQRVRTICPAAARWKPKCGFSFSKRAANRSARPCITSSSGNALSGKLVSRSRGFPPAAEFRRSIRDLLYLRRLLLPTFSDRVQDRREYRCRIYTLPETSPDRTIRPSAGNLAAGAALYGQPAYVEAQLWSDDPLRALPATLQS